MKYFCVLINILLIMAACDINRGLEPIRSNIEGTITYSGEWPGTPTEVRLVAADKFPPAGIEDLIIGESIPLTGTSYEYNFYLDPGEYNVLGVAWREDGSVWDILSICGLYFTGTDSLSPGKVLIATDTSTVKNIDVHVNRSNAKRITNSRIVGSIKFQGNWPDSLLEARVIATTRFSLNLINPILPTLLDLSFSSTIPIGSDSTTYTINAYSGTYVATGILFFKQGQSLSLADILYSATIGALDITPYEVTGNAEVHGPDFNVKFN